MTTVTLYNADCLEVLKTLEAGSVDAVVTDPPYGVELIARTTKHTTRKASTNYEDSIAFVLEEVIPRVKAFLKISKRGCVASGNRNLQIYPNAADIGGVFMPNGAGNSPWGFCCFHPVLYYGKSPHKGGRPTAVRATHWLSDDVDHPCPKPVKFMKWMIEQSTTAGETVIDPFMGSGTCGVACVQTGRNFIGIEIDPTYFAIAEKRINAELNRHPLFEAPSKAQKAMFA